MDRISPAGFWKGSSISFSVGSSKKVARRPKSGRVDESEIYEDLRPIEEVVEDGTLQKRFDQAAIKRKKAEEKAKSGLRIFYDDHDGAEDFLREKIRNARESVTIVDPYISSEELFAYAMATENRSAKVVVLTGSEKLVRKYILNTDDGENESSPYEIKDVDAMKEGIRRHREQNAGNIDVYIMKDKPYPIHDRFLVVDNAVWFCGSSFHSIGGRMSCIVRLPDGDEIIQYIEGLLYTDAVYKLEVE